MSSDLIQRLRRLERGFSAPCASRAEAVGLYEEALAFEDEVSRAVVLSEPAEVTSAWTALLRQFGSLNRSLQGAAALNEALANQVEAACSAIQGCAQLADGLPLVHNSTVRLGSTLVLVFDTGLRYLRQIAGMDFDASTKQEILLREVNRQLGTVAGVLYRVANPQRQPEAAAAFARAAGRPRAALPWLLAVSQVLLELPIVAAGSTADEPTDEYGNGLECYACVVNSLFSWLRDTYTSAVQQAPAIQQAVLSVLLDRCLPLLAADRSPVTAAEDSHPHVTLATYLSGALGTRCLQEALKQRLEQPNSGSYIQQALQVMAALPLQRSPSASVPDPFGEQHAGAAILLGTLCFHSPSVPASVEPLPSIAAMVAALAADSAIPEERLAKLSYGLTLAVGPQLQQPLTISNDIELAAWAAAANAALRLMPALLQLHHRCQGLDSSITGAEHLKQCPLLLARLLLGLLLEGCGPIAVKYAELKFLQPAAANAQLVQQLWALHTSMCRLIAWLAADPSGGRAAILLQGNLPGVAFLLEQLTHVRFVALLEGHCGFEHGVFSKDCLNGMRAAHWAALQTAIQALGGLQHAGHSLPHILSDLHSIAKHCDAVSGDTALAGMFDQAVALLAPALYKTPDVETAVAELVGMLPRLAAVMARSGTLQALLLQAQQFKDSRKADAAAGLVAFVKNALHSLDQGASQAAAAIEDANEQQRALLQRLQQAAGISTGLVRPGKVPIPVLVAQLPELSSRLPAAAKLADLLHEWFQQGRHAEAQLAVAQAAATRSCAYLRCANLGGEGGPAAGEGVGSQWCSACHVVWYCGTTCSHADWREGRHRRVCKALGAARRAAKEAAAAAGAASLAAERQEGS